MKRVFSHAATLLNNTFVNDCVLINFDCQQFGKYFAESWCETWHFKAAKDCFFLHLKICNNCVLHAGKQWNNICGKILSLQIRQIHRQELKQWKSNQVNAFLGNPSRWKDLRDYLPRPSGRRSVMYPHLKFCIYVGSIVCVNHCKDPCA